VAEQLISLGVITVFIGVVLIVIGGILSATKSKDKVGFAFGGFIGPIPFGFANREDLLKFVIVIAVAIMVSFLILDTVHIS